MSASEQSPRTDLSELPTYDLEYLVDDPDDPTTVTIISGNEDEYATTWITIDIEHAVSIETIR